MPCNCLLLLFSPFSLSPSFSAPCLLHPPRRNASFNAEGEGSRKSRYHVRFSPSQRQREDLFNSVCLYKSARTRSIREERTRPSLFLSRANRVCFDTRSKREGPLDKVSTGRPGKLVSFVRSEGDIPLRHATRIFDRRGIINFVAGSSASRSTTRWHLTCSGQRNVSFNYFQLRGHFCPRAFCFARSEDEYFATFRRSAIRGRSIFARKRALRRQEREAKRKRN
mgnify:CR=1 FL=1